MGQGMKEHFDKAASTWDLDPMKVERARATAKRCIAAAGRGRQKLLDFGGGTGLLSVFLRDHFQQITIADSSVEMLKSAETKIREADITNIETLRIEEGIGEVQGSYSAIITLMTLHHIGDVEGFVKDAAKLLDDDGMLLIADLYKEDGAFHKHAQDFDGHNGFDLESLSQLLRAYGLKVQEAEPYFEIEKEVSAGKVQTFPLFFLAAVKAG